MEFNTILEKRYSVRKYAETKVEADKLEQILKTIQAAPTAVNYQPVRIIVVQSPEGLASIDKATKLYHAPLALLICADTSVAWTRDNDNKNHGDIDASIATSYMMLKATELGLGSVWICRFDPAVIREEFKLPDNLEPVNILALGYPNEQSHPSKMHMDRKDPSEYIFYEAL